MKECTFLKEKLSLVPIKIRGKKKKHLVGPTLKLN